MPYILDVKKMSSYDIILKNCKERALYIIQNYDKTEQQLREKLQKTNIAKSLYYKKIIAKDENFVNENPELNTELNKNKEAHYTKKCIDETMEFLIRHHFIDDYSYARRYINSHNNKYSKNVIKQKLQLKGIKKQIIDEVFNEDEINFNDEQIAKKLLQKKYPDYYELYEKYQNSNELSFDEKMELKKYFMKITAFLVRKGFSYELVNYIMKLENYE